MRRFDPQSLSECDGKEGRPTCVAVGGRVYDVSASARWKGGSHMRRHEAGTDLTAELQAAPHGQEKLDAFPQVGVLAASEPEPGDDDRLPASVERLLARFPMLRRHPHPMTVHFPIVFAVSAFGFLLLGLLTGDDSLVATAGHSQAAGAIFTPVAIITGLAAWRVNYLGRPMHAVRLKGQLSLMLWAGFMGTYAVHWGMGTGTWYVWVELGMNALLVGLVSVIGWLGASLTFPVENG